MFSKNLSLVNRNCTQFKFYKFSKKYKISFNEINAKDSNSVRKSSRIEKEHKSPKKVFNIFNNSLKQFNNLLYPRYPSANVGRKNLEDSLYKSSGSNGLSIIKEARDFKMEKMSERRLNKICDPINPTIYERKRNLSLKLKLKSNCKNKNYHCAKLASVSFCKNYTENLINENDFSDFSNFSEFSDFSDSNNTHERNFFLSYLQVIKQQGIVNSKSITFFQFLEILFQLNLICSMKDEIIFKLWLFIRGDMSEKVNIIYLYAIILCLLKIENSEVISKEFEYLFKISEICFKNFKNFKNSISNNSLPGGKNLDFRNSFHFQLHKLIEHNSKQRYFINSELKNKINQIFHYQIEFRKIICNDSNIINNNFKAQESHIHLSKSKISNKNNAVNVNFQENLNLNLNLSKNKNKNVNRNRNENTKRIERNQIMSFNKCKIGNKNNFSITPIVEEKLEEEKLKLNLKLKLKSSGILKSKNSRQEILCKKIDLIPYLEKMNKLLKINSQKRMTYSCISSPQLFLEKAKRNSNIFPRNENIQNISKSRVCRNFRNFRNNKKGYGHNKSTLSSYKPEPKSTLQENLFKTDYFKNNEPPFQIFQIQEEIQKNNLKKEIGSKEDKSKKEQKMKTVEKKSSLIGNKNKESSKKPILLIDVEIKDNVREIIPIFEEDSTETITLKLIQEKGLSEKEALKVCSILEKQIENIIYELS